MDKTNLNPLIIFAFYILRCLVPLGVMLGISYLLRRFGLIQESAPPPEDWTDEDNHENSAEGGLANG